MSEPTPPKKEHLLTRKIGPLPTWGWVGIAAFVLVAIAWWTNRNTQSTSATTADASQVPQFVNQTFTNPEPPEGPPMPPRHHKHHRRDRDHHDRDQQSTSGSGDIGSGPQKPPGGDVPVGGGPKPPKPPIRTRERVHRG